MVDLKNIFRLPTHFAYRFFSFSVVYCVNNDSTVYFLFVVVGNFIPSLSFLSISELISTAGSVVPKKRNLGKQIPSMSQQPKHLLIFKLAISFEMTSRLLFLLRLRQVGGKAFDFHNGGKFFDGKC